MSTPEDEKIRKWNLYLCATEDIPRLRQQGLHHRVYTYGPKNIIFIWIYPPKSNKSKGDVFISFAQRDVPISLTSLYSEESGWIVEEELFSVC